MLSRLRLSEDLGLPVQFLVLGLLLATLALLAMELRGHKKRRTSLFLTGAVGALLLTAAVLRPSRLTQQGQEVPGLSVVLLDGSHRLGLPSRGGGESRRSVALEAKRSLQESWESARVLQRQFSRGLEALDSGKPEVRTATAKEKPTQGPNGAEKPDADVEALATSDEWGSQNAQSDLLSALRQVASGEGERPQSIVVLSDGRLTRPGDAKGEEWDRALKEAGGGIPVHTVQVAPEELTDRSVRKVGFTGSAIAHQPLNLKLEIGCEPKSTCDEVEVVVRELLEGQEPQELGRGQTKGENGIAELDLQVTLERAGGRVIEVELLSDEPDDVPENDRRILPVQVRRDRLRMLHVAGRPTYDVRALRMFLKSDESIDLISFFILRTQSDQVQARQDELALIPFPVDELFNEHLRSFDAVILQDIDAPRYQLDRHFASIKDYVLGGGGLILVGGHTGFSSGGYAGSPVADVLPVELPLTGKLISRKPFVPVYTEAGRAAPALKSLRTTLGEQLPEMSGTNLLGRPKDGAVVLWSHPTLSTAGQSGGELMPILALSEEGDGRTIAISVDSSHQLRFGQAGTETGGRAYGDLWGGLLGWLMRDPRYESAQLKLEGECLSGRDAIVRVESLSSGEGGVAVELERLGSATSDARQLEEVEPAPDGARRFVARALQAGGYAARVKVGAAPPTRTVFACERGGAAWADSRPDGQRLQAIAQATGGSFVEASEIKRLPQPPSTFISARQKSSALLPVWIWAGAAALLLSLHWFLRRTEGHV